MTFGEVPWSDGAFLVAQRLKHLPGMRETWVRSLCREDPLEKEMATHSSILAWRIPWTQEPGRLQSTGSQSWTRLSDFTFTFMEWWFYPSAPDAQPYICASCSHPSPMRNFRQHSLSPASLRCPWQPHLLMLKCDCRVDFFFSGTFLKWTVDAAVFAHPSTCAEFTAGTYQPESNQVL